MLNFITSKSNNSNHAIARALPSRFSLLRAGLLAISLCWLNSVEAQAQSRTLPSHGKIRLDSYNYLLRDVHPASQAQSNYLQNRLFLTGLKKPERLERQERVDVYGERRFVKQLQNYNAVANRLSAGRPTSAMSLMSFWTLVSVYGDRTEVYDALSSDVPPISHDQFMPTTVFIQIVRPNGELEPPPLLLEAAEGVDASMYQSAWAALTKNVNGIGRLSAQDVADFHNSVAVYRKRGTLAIANNASASGRLRAQEYLVALGSLADALYRPQQSARIEQYVRQGGYSYHGGSMLELIQHMLRNRVTPAQGSTAQVALAEVARPISRVLEQEIALHYERIDSQAAGEGHRPYAAEYRQHEESGYGATPGTQVTQAIVADDSGT